MTLPIEKLSSRLPAQLGPPSPTEGTHYTTQYASTEVFTTTTTTYNWFTTLLPFRVTTTPYATTFIPIPETTPATRHMITIIPIRTHPTPNMNTPAAIGNSTVNLTSMATYTTNGSYENVSLSLPITPTPNVGLLCGFPSFCDSSALTECSNITLMKCDRCSPVVAGVFIAFVMLLGLLAILCNLLVVWHSVKQSKHENKINKMKGSLAVADMMIGFHILSIPTTKLFWTISSTSDQIDAMQLSYQNSVAAFVGGIFYVSGFSSSLFHLLLLSAQRFMAITFPIRYKFQSNARINFYIALAWLLGILAASSPAFFPSDFVYSYSHVLFLFHPAPRGSTSGLSNNVAAVFIIFYITPYVLMTVLTMISGISIRFRFKQSASISGNDKRNRKAEKHAFVVLAFMQLGFTLTLVPFVVVVLLFYSSILKCATMSSTYVTCVYLNMVNSLVNFIVYSARETQFRATVKSILTKKNPVVKPPTSRPTPNHSKESRV
ncbi:trace amine-associated receptor 8b-like [Ciona intestinalis]